MEGYLRFKIDWGSLMVGSKFTVFALLYFVFEGNFSSTTPLGAYTWRGDLTEGFLRYRFGGPIVGETAKSVKSLGLKDNATNQNKNEDLFSAHTNGVG